MQFYPCIRPRKQVTEKFEMVIFQLGEKDRLSNERTKALAVGMRPCRHRLSFAGTRQRVRCSPGTKDLLPNRRTPAGRSCRQSTGRHLPPVCNSRDTSRLDVADYIYATTELQKKNEASVKRFGRKRHQRRSSIQSCGKIFKLEKRDSSA